MSDDQRCQPYDSPEPTHDVLIRDAVDDDATAIAALYNDLGVATTATWRLEPVTADDRRAWLREQRAAGFPVLVAEDEGGVVAYAGYGTFRPLAGYRHTVENTMWVSPEAQGHGVGRRLMDELIARARRQGVHVMVGAVDADNHASLAFQRACGFAEVGRMPQTGRKHGQWRDLVLMQRVLDATDVPPTHD